MASTRSASRCSAIGPAQGRQPRGLGSPECAEDVPFSNLGKLLQGKRDVGQKELALLASSKVSEASFERREGDSSVMTYFLTQKLKAGGPVTLTQAFDYVKEQVPAYVRQQYRNATQTPVLLD